ncbi:Peptidase family M28 [Desulfacinum hydrothermale DSM 13146]|uniref:Peptidase family M28 n=1 Tax=Desulfacinum hydrothermale DSM 13146 TaxID=1121390 RepID=A0A1W1XGK0_9BACT|nr:M28 family peptidase [Desulfacinum hydrothermale]SMC22902.1 Peptidase family M28 [Desulfacinum hydrothermale DSM 13146]
MFSGVRSSALSHPIFHASRIDLTIHLKDRRGVFMLQLEGERMAIHWIDGVELEAVEQRLRHHLHRLTVEIGERSVADWKRHRLAADYIAREFGQAGMDPQEEPYTWQGRRVANILAETPARGSPIWKRIVVGAHYDSLTGTVGADDNASAVAVLLETARLFAGLRSKAGTCPAVQFAAFALEEPPVYGTQAMGSRVRARNARKHGERLDGMICLEMVGYTCRTPGCQDYPWPLRLKNYPDTGDFIGIVGNGRSRGFLRAMEKAFRKNPHLPVITLTVPFNGWLIPSVRLSDHAPFWDHGYRAVMVTDSAFYRNPHYHTTADTLDTLDFPFMAQLVKSLLFFLFP